MVRLPDEKRRYIRLEMPIKIIYNAKNDNQMKESFSKDISAEGLRFIASSPINPGAEIELKISLPDATNPVHIQGKTVWCSKTNQGDEIYEVGVEFVKIEEDNKNTFLKFLCDTMYKQAKKLSA